MEGIVQRLRGADRATLVASLTGSDTGRAAGLGAAVIAVNVVALVFTVVFARVLGASDYGSLAALISAFIILMVPGSALQIATARVVSHALADGDPMAGSGVRRWLLRLTFATMVVALAAIPAALASGRHHQRRRAVGRCGGARYGDALDADFSRARSPAGIPALPGAGLEPRRRVSRAAPVRHSARCRGLDVTGAFVASAL